MEYVIDASVVAKWLFIEEDTPKARILRTRFFTGTDQPLAPALLLSEVGNVIWKYQQQGVITEDEAQESMKDLLALQLPLVEPIPLLEQALTLAMTYHRPLYDTLYLALAVSRDVEFITADERFYNALTLQFPRIKWLRTMPL